MHAPATVTGFRPAALTMIVAELDDGREVGSVTIERRKRDIYQVTSLFVHEAYRRQGIGRSLMAAAAAHANERNGRISMWVDPGNLVGQFFARACGLVRT
jgi:ribosomal protein S18 acetylase RimI-like enzyme